MPTKKPPKKGQKQHTKEEAVELASQLVQLGNQVAGIDCQAMFDGFGISSKVLALVENGKSLYVKGDFHNATLQFGGAMKLMTANMAWFFVNFVKIFSQRLDDINTRLLGDYEDLQNRGNNILTKLQELATETENKVRESKQCELDFEALSAAHWNAKNKLEEIKLEAQTRIERAEAERAEAERAEAERLAAEERAAELERERLAAQRRAADMDSLFAGSALELTPQKTKEDAA